ncbi:MAG: FAD-dependent oxidoreductase [Actinobacteria bacterium]|nr:FAD-dependent oxidoreductase [Actinomycetota bacterium]
MTPVPGDQEPATTAAPVFPNYMQMRRRMPIGAWHVLRVGSVAAFLVLCVTLVVRPAGGLFVLWGVLIPSLPLLLLVAPGLWRNICPLAAANQTPRLLGFTRGRTAPKWMRERGYLLAISLFIAVVTTRKVVFDTNGPAVALLLMTTIVAAFVGGVLLKGKSGWCSTICPLLPVQRLYGQTPFATVPNGHCQPCVGCTKNCYDFNPGVAYQADMYDADQTWSAPRKLFAGAFLGLIVAFFTLPTPPALSRPELYVRFAAYVLVSAGAFFALDSVLRISTSKLAAVFATASINTFYWHSSRTLARSFGEMFGTDGDGIVWPLRALVLSLSAWWLLRTLRAERKFVAASVSQPVRLAPSQVQALSGEGRGSDGPEVHVVPENLRVIAAEGNSLLEVLEGADLPIEAGCRMGMCGSDPIAVLEGAEHVTPVAEEECNTLRRLGLGSTTRMACCARVTGDVRISLVPEKGDARATAPAVFDTSLRSVVVIGNGIAGITAADFVRRGHPDCEIHVIGQEPHPLYNRMGISRLIYGRSAMQGLYLLPDSWYEDHGITCWLNTQARRIDLEAQHVILGTGESLAFSRLILAMGSSSSVPPFPGFGLPGSFVLREASDAIAIRSFAQHHGASRAVVAGGGLLGLESAYALRQLGLAVTVLERSERLLRKQVDERCSQLLASYLDGLGIEFLTGVEVSEVSGDDRVRRALLSDGNSTNCDLFLVCAGIRPNAQLAKEAGIEVRAGVLVDSGMRTSHRGVFAAGDVTELEGQVLGLWPVSVAQAEVAATNALGGQQALAQALPVAILKGLGIDLTSVGRFQPAPEDEVIVVDDGQNYAYGKLIVSDGKLVGGIILGRPQDAPHLIAAVKRHADVRDQMERLRQGDWDALATPPTLVGT